MVIADVATVLVSIVALWLGARWLVAAASRLASAVGVSALIVGLTVVAFGTSAPEFAVTIEAALADRADVSVGNVVGSNVFNLGVILGGVAIVHPFRTTDSLVRRDAVVMAGITVLALAFLANAAISRLEGVVLCLLLVAYLGGLVVAARGEIRTEEEKEGETTVPSDDSTRTLGSDTADTETSVTTTETVDWLDVPKLLVGLVLVVVGGRLLVGAATDLAQTVGVSEWIIGVTIVAAGTSVPELVTSLVAARDGDVGIAAGNVVGSNVFNLLGVLGIAAVIRPMTVATDALVGLVWLFVLTVIATALLATGRRLTRLEGIALVGFVAVYWVVALG
ncbi:calcium/sodium antiporter [Halobacteria archaeon AArc-m2/3/4]|uniref:Calcium/sodium antiporter n=1 Tax=Natronoglomus mannanivorans TaxID=2979990 RepID=A0ABT2QE49_9EURY|nr:calcium/sodium antiporter [Halobacteria archaeon AArc-m2/3/4]